MHFFKRALGVKLFLAVWLLVLLIPLWRLRATRQWQSDQFYQIGPDKPSVVLGLTDEGAREAARRFPDDASAQLANLSRPYLGRSDSIWPAQSEMQRATDAYFSRYAALSRRFPDDLLIRSKWLRDTTVGALHIESKGLTDSYKFPGGTQTWPNWMSNAQLERAISLARESGRMEPDNAFWPWMEAILDFSLRRDDAALRALEHAGKCAHFDDRIDATTRSRIALMKRVQVVDYDDEWFEAVAALFPHYARMRAAARETMWQANLAFKRSDPKRALQIAEILQNASAPVARNSGFYIGRLVGEAMCYIAWRGTMAYAGKTPIDYNADEDPQKQSSRRAQVAQFADFARQHGRADLAKGATQLQTTFDNLQITAALKNPDFDGWWQATQPLTRLHWLNAHLLHLALLSALIWAIAVFISRRDTPLTPRNRRRLVLCSAFCVGATLAILAASVFLGAVDQPNLFDATSTLPSSAAFEQGLPWVLVLLWSLPPVVLALLSSFKRPRFDFKSRQVNWRNIVGIGLDVGTFGLFCIVADALSETLENTVAGQFWPLPMVLFALFFVSRCVFRIWNSPPERKWGTIWNTVSVAIFMATLLFYVQRPTPQVQGLPLALYELALLGVLISAALSFHFNLEGQSLAPFWKQLVFGARIAAATLAVCSTIAYFLLIGVSAPFRNHAQKVLNAELREGEAAYVEAQLQTKNPAPE